ncbi:MAG: AMP-dependent synthetase/ligase [Candidatus Dormiibacterota bacterium]
MTRDIQAEQAELERLVGDRTMASVFAGTVAAHRDEPALSWKTADGWHTLTWGEYHDQVRLVALGLRAIGFAPGEFGAIMARNRPEHLVADLGIMHAQGTPVSLYNTLAAEQVQYIAAHCEAAVAFVEDAGFLDRFKAVRDQLPALRKVIVMEPLPNAEDDWLMSWQDLLELGRRKGEEEPELFDMMWRQVGQDDLATLIYTSGTTGPPKGVMDSQRQVVAMTEIGYRFTPTVPGHRHISYLPFAHAFERYIGHWHAIAWAGHVYFCPDPAQLFAYAAEVHPMAMIGVPRVWEKLAAALQAGIAAEPDEQRRAGIQSAIDVGRQVARLKQAGKPLPPELEAAVEKCRPVWQALRAKVGLDQAEFAITGAAPIGIDVIEFFQAIELRLVEGWGMTETTVGATFAPDLDSHRNGTVGQADFGDEVVLAADGEILVRGPNIAQGYYKMPEQTAETFDADGWLHTGDIGTIDDDGYVSIVDRKKELIITAGGKNISPANLENLLKQHPLVGQACAIGDRRPFVSALIVLDQEVAPGWAQRQGIEFPSIAELAEHPAVVAAVQEAVDECNRHVSQVESIRKFAILPVEWTAESEELTPTLKLKRRVVFDKYGDVVERMYSSPAPQTEAVPAG